MQNSIDARIRGAVIVVMVLAGLCALINSALILAVSGSASYGWAWDTVIAVIVLIGVAISTAATVALFKVLMMFIVLLFEKYSKK